MTQTYLDHRDATSLEELLAGLEALEESTERYDVVYLTRPVRVSLFEETLTDGSLVKNIDLTFLD